MKRAFYLLTSMLLIVGISGCDSAENDSPIQSLEGSYSLNYMVNKLTDITLYTGENKDSFGVTVKISGSLFFTDHNYEVSVNIQTTINGQVENDIEHDIGSYIQKEKTITLINSEDESETVNYIYDGFNLILESDESSIHFLKN